MTGGNELVSSDPWCYFIQMLRLMLMSCSRLHQIHNDNMLYDNQFHDASSMRDRLVRMYEALSN